MAKERNIQCINYICENQCTLGKEANFYGYCQHCQKYAAKPGSAPARTDLRREKLNKILKREDRQLYND